MKKILILSLSLLVAVFSFADKKDKDQAPKWQYEIQPAVGQAAQGSVIVRVWSLVENPNLADVQARKDAVHGIMFMGYAPSADKNRIPGRRPLIADSQIEQANSAYFDSFFADGGQYQRYASLAGSGVPEQVIKIDKKIYKVALNVVVLVDELRKRLEQDGFVKKLDEIVDGKVPTLMVVPSDQWCRQNRYVTADNQPDYFAAVTSSQELLQAIAEVNTLFSSRNFPLKNLESSLKTIQTQQAENAMLSSKSGGELVESPIDQLKQVAHADIWIKIDWKINALAGGSQKSLSFVMQGLDAYSDKQIAGATGTGKAVYASQAQVPVMLEEAILGHVNNFCNQLTEYFTDVQKNGRELTIRIRVFDDFGADLESDYDGEELGVLIEEWIAAHTLNGKFNTTIATANQMLFENVSVPLQNARGRDLDARTWLRPLQRELMQKYGIESKLMTQGLGAATLVLGSK